MKAFQMRIRQSGGGGGFIIVIKGLGEIRVRALGAVVPKWQGLVVGEYTTVRRIHRISRKTIRSVLLN